jgi:hypothetical protein
MFRLLSPQAELSTRQSLPPSDCWQGGGGNYAPPSGLRAPVSSFLARTLDLVTLAGATQAPWFGGGHVHDPQRRSGSLASTVARASLWLTTARES